MKLEYFVEYIFYNPKTDRLITAIFARKGAAFLSEEKPDGVWLDISGNMEFHGKYGYELIGTVL
jgi:hypothetical protein